MGSNRKRTLGPQEDERDAAGGLDEARNRLQLFGVTFRTRTAEEALQCSERCAADLTGPIHQGTLRPVLDRVFPLADLPAAHAYMLSNSQCGKIVLSTEDVQE